MNFVILKYEKKWKLEYGVVKHRTSLPLRKLFFTNILTIKRQGGNCVGSPLSPTELSSYGRRWRGMQWTCRGVLHYSWIERGSGHGDGG